LIEEHRSSYWHVMTLELDSISFLRHLLSQSNTNLSDEFVESSYLRYLDKQNHYRGLKRIASVLFGMSEECIDQQIRRRCAEPLRSIPLPTDEFALLLAVALDKATKLHASDDNIALFDALGADCLGQWIRLVNRDNAVHYENAVGILKRRYASRIQEAERLLEQLSSDSADAHGLERAAVFFHDEDVYPDRLLHNSRRALLEALHS